MKMPVDLQIVPTHLSGAKVGDESAYDIGYLGCAYVVCKDWPLFLDFEEETWLAKRVLCTQ